ncbi:MAG: hypothetical protein WDN67_02170 [Candidatus Moraniibacteriota bacterium]
MGEKILMVKVVKRANANTQKQTEEKEETLLHTLEQTSKEQLALRAAQSASLPYIDLSIFPVEEEVTELFPREQVEKLRVALFQKERGVARFGFIDPESTESQAAVEAFIQEHQLTAKRYVISENSLTKILELYDRKPFLERLDTLAINLSGEDLVRFEKDFGELLALKEGSAVGTSRIIEIILAGAGKLGASDVHIEPEEAERACAIASTASWKIWGICPERCITSFFHESRCSAR